MTTVFLYGTLRDPDVQEIVIGKSFPERKALLKGFKAVFVLGEVFPKYLEDERFDLLGTLVDVDDEQLKKIDIFEGVAGGDFVKEEVTVECDDQQVKALTYDGAKLEKTSRKWTLEEWEKLYKKSYLERVEKFVSEDGGDW